jgi:DNA-binding protein YbaB
MRHTDEDFAEVRQRLGELDVRLAERRFTAGPKTGGVEAIVDGRSGLVDLRIDDNLIRGAHPQTIGPAIVEAVTNARVQASGAARTSVEEILDPASGSVPPDGQPAAETRFVSPRPARPEVEEDGEEFDIFAGQRDNRRRP